jgi:hypothetical protein
MPSVSDMHVHMALTFPLLPKKDHEIDVFASRCISRGIDQSLCDVIKKKSYVFR